MGNWNKKIKVKTEGIFMQNFYIFVLLIAGYLLGTQVVKKGQPKKKNTYEDKQSYLKK